MFFAVVLLAFRAAPSPAADTALAPVARAELDSALAVVRHNALWRDTVSWGVVEPEVRAAAAGATTAGEVYPAIRLLLRRLGDHHSRLLEPAAASAWSTGRPSNEPPLVGNVGDSLGYIAVPGYSGDAPDALVRRADARAEHGQHADPAAGRRATRVHRRGRRGPYGPALRRCGRAGRTGRTGRGWGSG